MGEINNCIKMYKTEDITLSKQYSVTITDKGQITIPTYFYNKYNMKKDSVLKFILNIENKEVLIEKFICSFCEGTGKINNMECLMCSGTGTFLKEDDLITDFINRILKNTSKYGIIAALENDDKNNYKVTIRVKENKYDEQTLKNVENYYNKNLKKRGKKNERIYEKF